MKKQILTMAMCVALSTTVASAEVTKTVMPKVTTPAKVSSTLPVKTQATVAPSATLSRPEPPKMMTREEAKKCFDERKAKGRDHLYSELGLSAEQKQKAEALEVKNRSEVLPLVGKLKTEAKKLGELKAKHASVFAIWKQENTVKASKKALEKKFEASRKSFEALLTPEQKAKFEAKKKEMDKCRKNHKPNCHKGYHCPKGGHGPEHMGPPPAGMGPEGMGPDGPHGPEPMGPPPENK